VFFKQELNAHKIVGIIICLCAGALIGGTSFAALGPEALLGCALPEGQYAACKFFSGSYVLDAAPGDTLAFGDIPPHSAVLIKVERQGDAPVIVASDMHFAMGGEFDRLEVKDGRLCFKLKAAYDYPGQYKVWLPDGRVEALSVNGFEEQEGSRAL